MGAPPRRHDEDRLFVRDGWRHYRRSYSRHEVRWGFAVLGGLLGITAWVAYRGAHPDPQLFGVGAALLAASPAAMADRGPLPSGLASSGWREGSPSQFDDDNLYMKINGRADYFKSFGFRRLFAISLTHEDPPARSVDIELYDLGSAANALGAFAGERSPGSTPTLEAGAMSAIDRNALLLVRGRYYARVIGGDEAPTVLTQLRHLRAVLSASLPGEPLPWGHAFFVGTLGFKPEAVAYLPENAFSLGFARDVFAAKVAGEGLELFIVAARDEVSAARLAQQFMAGFARVGEHAGRKGGVAWIEERFVGALSGAKAHARWVVGVRRAADVEQAVAALERLVRGVERMPETLAERARPDGTGGAAEPEEGSGE